MFFVEDKSLGWLNPTIRFRIKVRVRTRVELGQIS